MIEFLISTLIFLSGFCAGIIATMATAMRRKAEETEFDGGYAASNHPPVRTQIWSPSVINREDKP